MYEVIQGYPFLFPTENSLLIYSNGTVYTLQEAADEAGVMGLSSEMIGQIHRDYFGERTCHTLLKDDPKPVYGAMNALFGMFLAGNREVSLAYYSDWKDPQQEKAVPLGSYNYPLTDWSSYRFRGWLIDGTMPGTEETTASFGENAAFRLAESSGEYALTLYKDGLCLFTRKDPENGQTEYLVYDTASDLFPYLYGIYRQLVAAGPAAVQYCP